MDNGNEEGSENSKKRKLDVPPPPVLSRQTACNWTSEEIVEAARRDKRMRNERNALSEAVDGLSSSMVGSIKVSEADKVISNSVPTSPKHGSKER